MRRWRDEMGWEGWRRRAGRKEWWFGYGMERDRRRSAVEESSETCTPREIDDRTIINLEMETYLRSLFENMIRDCPDWSERPSYRSNQLNRFSKLMLVSQKPQKDVVSFRIEFFQTCDRTFDSIDDDIDEVGKSIRFPVYWQWPLLQIALVWSHEP